MSDLKLIDVPLDAIDLGDSRFRISFGRELEPLIESIKAVGLTSPPQLQPKGTGKFRPVIGFRRIEVLSRLRVERIPAIAFSPSARDVDLFELAMRDNQSVHPLNPIECSIILSKLTKEFDVPTKMLLDKYMPMLNLGRNPDVLRRYMTLAELEDPVKQWVAEERLSLDVAAQLAEMSHDDRRAFFGMVESLRFGKNHQRELLTLCKDVARIMGLTVSRLRVDKELCGIVANESVSRPHRTEKLKRWLIEKRYPRLVGTTGRSREN
jgi:hypothetical protein